MITSRNNPMIKEIRSLQQRKGRERRGLFFAEGIRIIAEAVELGAEIELGVVAAELLDSSFAAGLVEIMRTRGIPILEVSGDIFASLSRKDGPQGIGAIIRQRWETLADVELGAGLGWIALHEVQDPGNLGTILRTADAVGGSGVILVGPATDPYDPAALRASMGAIFSQRLVRATPQQLLDWKQAYGYPLVGTSDAATADYHRVGYPVPLVLFMGSERQGLTPDELAACDLMVRIPQVGRSDSLNLAVATGVVLYEIFNQQRDLTFAPSLAED